MTNSIRAGIALLMLSGIGGCGDGASPSAPSGLPAPSVQQPRPQPTAVQPSVTAVAPRTGSTRGGAWATVTGADFQPGATVRVGDGTVTTWVRDSAAITFWTTAHIAGIVDIVVINPGGLEARLIAAYTYAPPASFDFNGVWIAHAGPDYETEMRFTIRNDVLVSVSCGASGSLTLTPAPSVRDGEFSFLGDDGVAISGTLVSPVNAVGTINVSACPSARWWADKSGDAVTSADR